MRPRHWLLLINPAPRARDGCEGDRRMGGGGGTGQDGWDKQRGRYWDSWPLSAGLDPHTEGRGCGPAPWSPRGGGRLQPFSLRPLSFLPMEVTPSLLFPTAKSLLILAHAHLLPLSAKLQGEPFCTCECHHCVTCHLSSHRSLVSAFLWVRSRAQPSLLPPRPPAAPALTTCCCLPETCSSLRLP